MIVCYNFHIKNRNIKEKIQFENVSKKMLKFYTAWSHICLDVAPNQVTLIRNSTT